MTTHTATTEVSTHIDVQAPIAHVFDVFTGQIGSWWDTDHHILGAPLAEMIFERYVGGHIIDRGIDGSQSRWARVLAYEPPTRVCFSWDITTCTGSSRPTRPRPVRSRSFSPSCRRTGHTSR